MTKKQLEDVLKRREELEVKSKADIKVLVKEVKSLRNSQAELKKDLSQSQKEKSDAEVIHGQILTYMFISYGMKPQNENANSVFL